MGQTVMNTTRHCVVVALFLAAIVSGACAPAIESIDAGVEVRAVDLRPHSREGFLFSPDAYPGPFEAVGLVTVTLYASAEWREGTDGFGGRTANWYFGPLSLDTAISRARVAATALGADALVSVTLRPTSKTAAANNLPSLPGIEVSGFAIVRKDR
jgi:hypothetical protein